MIPVSNKSRTIARVRYKHANLFRQEKWRLAITPKNQAAQPHSHWQRVEDNASALGGSAPSEDDAKELNEGAKEKSAERLATPG